MSRARTLPDPEDPRKPDEPTHLTKRSWVGVLTRTVREFKEDDCTDWAAALTYYGVLAIFPALIALTSLIGLVGDPRKITDAPLRIVAALGPAPAVEPFAGPVRTVAENQSAGLALGDGRKLKPDRQTTSER